jgi:hypothetical protein
VTLGDQRHASDSLSDGATQICRAKDHRLEENVPGPIRRVTGSPTVTPAMVAPN